MGYYMGDFYRGDWYQGDPFWGTVLGLGRRLLGGAIGRKALPAAGRAAEAIVMKPAGKIVRTVMGHPVLSAAAATGAIGAMAGIAGERAALGPGMAPKGFHPCKHPGKCKHALVRNRHMRVTNPRALRRSLRRIGGFARVARRVLHFTHPRAARGRARFKFPRRKK